MTKARRTHKKLITREICEYRKIIQFWKGTHIIWERCGSLARHQVRHFTRRIERLKELR